MRKSTVRMSAFQPTRLSALRGQEGQLWVLVVQKRAGGSIDAVSRHGRFCNRRRTHVGGSYALIAAISGLVPMMFMTRVIL